MIAGGAEELCATEAAVFDTLFATSVRNDAAETTPRPFDIERDGLVLGEGAGTLILEEYEHARAREAHIYAEVVGFGTNSDGSHVTHPKAATMQRAMDGIDANLPIRSVTSMLTAPARNMATSRIVRHRNLFRSRADQFIEELRGIRYACGALEA
jgi:3-oxoacyl-[acyl-carrier-protein] synthase II